MLCLALNPCGSIYTAAYHMEGYAPPQWEKKLPYIFEQCQYTLGLELYDRDLRYRRELLTTTIS